MYEKNVPFMLFLPIKRLFKKLYDLQVANVVRNMETFMFAIDQVLRVGVI